MSTHLTDNQGPLSVCQVAELNTYRRHGLLINHSTEQEGKMTDISCPRSLHRGRMDKDGISAIEVRVHHYRGPPSQVDELLPPVGDVICGPPRLEEEIALKPPSRAVLELFRQLLHLGELLIVEQRPNAPQVLKKFKTWSSDKERILLMIKARFFRISSFVLVSSRLKYRHNLHRILRCFYCIKKGK